MIEENDHTQMSEEHKDNSRKPISRVEFVTQSEAPNYSDEQIKAMLKGKSMAERKRFLIELEQQR